MDLDKLEKDLEVLKSTYREKKLSFDLKTQSRRFSSRSPSSDSRSSNMDSSKIGKLSQNESSLLMNKSTDELFQNKEIKLSLQKAGDTSYTKELSSSSCTNILSNNINIQNIQPSNAVFQTLPPKFNKLETPSLGDQIFKPANIKQSSNKENIPISNLNSLSLTSALKALQDKCTTYEKENELLRKQISESQITHKRDVDDLKSQLIQEIEKYRQRETQLKDNMMLISGKFDSSNKNFEKMQNSLKEKERENSMLKDSYELGSEKIRALFAENAMMKKEIELLENEKEQHLEFNSSEKNNYEAVIKSMNMEIEKLLSIIEDNKAKLLAINREKNSAEGQRIKLLEELNTIKTAFLEIEKAKEVIERDCKEKLNASHREKDELLKKTEKERKLYAAKIANLEEKLACAGGEKEERIQSLKRINKELLKENKELKAENKDIYKEIMELKRKIDSFEKGSAKTTNTERGRNNELLKSVLSANEELYKKLKLQKKKKSASGQRARSKDEKRVHTSSVEVCKSARSTKRVSSTSKLIAQSRSPSIKNQSKPEKKMKPLHLDDLVESSNRSSFPPFDTKSDLMINSIENSQKKKKKKKSISIIENNSNVSAITFESVGNTPNRSSDKKKGSNKLIKAGKEDHDIRKNSHMQNTNKQVDTPSDKSMVNSCVSGRFFNEKNILMSSNNLTNVEFTHSKSNYGQQHMSPNSYHGLISVNDINDKDFCINETMDGNNTVGSSLRSAQSDKPVAMTQSAAHPISMMNESEISSEIIKLERLVADLKREYKNLLIRSQEDTLSEESEKFRKRLNDCATEMQSKTEHLLQLKKRKKEIISKTIIN